MFLSIRVQQSDFWNQTPNDELTCPATGDLRGAGEGGGGQGASPEALTLETGPLLLHMAGRSGMAHPGGRPWNIQTSAAELILTCELSAG